MRGAWSVIATPRHGLHWGLELLFGLCENSLKQSVQRPHQRIVGAERLAQGLYRPARRGSLPCRRVKLRTLPPRNR